MFSLTSDIAKNLYNFTEEWRENQLSRGRERERSRESIEVIVSLWFCCCCYWWNFGLSFGIKSSLVNLTSGNWFFVFEYSRQHPAFLFERQRERERATNSSESFVCLLFLARRVKKDLFVKCIYYVQKYINILERLFVGIN